MRTAFVFPVLIALMSVVNWAISSNTANNQTPLPTKTCDKAVVCNCNLNQADSRVGEDIKTLKTNIKSLIALVNHTFSPQPKPSAMPASSCKKQYEKHSEAITTLGTKLENLVALVNKTSTPQAKPPANHGWSCRKQLENHTDAIKMLETKLENLVALVNKTSTPQAKPPANSGLSCEKQFENHTKAIKKLETKLENLTALIDKIVIATVYDASSCNEAYEIDRAAKTKVYTLRFGSKRIPLYCHMGNFGCGDGGWTLAMKIDGTKRTFHYSSHFWSDRNGYNFAGGQTDFDSQETKLPTYWNTPFSKICLGMRIGKQVKFIVINEQATSLHSLIADGKYRKTSLGRKTWKALIGSQASLQSACDKEGFNVAGGANAGSKARIGMIGDDQADCGGPDSRIGFGTGGQVDDSNTCGNEATYSPDNGNRHVKAMGYILVQ